MNEEPVYNPDAEQAVLGAIILDNKYFKQISEVLTAEDFYEAEHRTIYQAIERLHKKDTEIDVITLTNELTESGEIAQAGGAAYVVELTNVVPTARTGATYAKIVADDAKKRVITKAGQAILDKSSNGVPLDEVMETVKEQIHKVNTLGGKNGKYQVSSMMDYVESSKERYKNWGKMQGLSTGFPALDNLTLGLCGGELVIIAGPTSRGKTLLAMNIANNIAKKDKRVLFVTLEMTKEELTSRYMYANDGWETEEFAIVTTNTIFQENDELDWQDIDGLIENAKNELDVDLVVIDHLHYFTRELQNVAEDLGRITKEFKKNAIRYNIPIILISHIRKLQKDEELSGDSLRGSSLIAQDSDIVLMVNRDPETNAMGILIDKNRNRGKLSDRTRVWNGRTERELNTIYLEFNNTKLKDPTDVMKTVNEVFPETKPYKH